MATSPRNKVFAGPRVRRLRRDLGLTQIQMARELEVSASYLNLIERNQRPLTAQLILKLADNYEIDLRTLAGDEDGRMVAELKEIFSDPVLGDLDVGDQELIDMTASSPTATQAMVSLYGAYQQLKESVAGLGETVTTDGAAAASETLAPLEQVRDYLTEQGNYFPALELAAEALHEDLEGSGDTYQDLVRHMKTVHGIAVRIMPIEYMDNLVRRLDRHSGRLFLSEILPPSGRCFQIAHQIGLLTCTSLMDELTEQSGLQGEESKHLLRLAYANYFAGAVQMPYEPFLHTAEKMRYDIELLGHRFGASFEQVCHRLTTLQRPGSKGVPFFFVRIDHAGNVSKRFSASSFHFARYGGPCPRWSVHDAFRTPGKILTQMIQMPDDAIYYSVCRTVGGLNGGFGEQSPQFAIAVGCKLSDAAKLVYADGTDLDAVETATPIGSTCRLCDRLDCTHRAFAPLNRPLTVDPNRRGSAPLSFTNL